MARRIHTNSKIFFPDPYIVRIEYPDQTEESCSSEFIKMRRKTYKLIRGTWGHTNLETEMIGNPNDTRIYSSVTPMGNFFMPRAYFCFQGEMDVLQFRLSINTRAIQVHMWPSTLKFTIHEYYADTEEDKELDIAPTEDS